MFGRMIWDKLLEHIFENLEIAQVKLGQFQNIHQTNKHFKLKLKFLTVGNHK